MLGWVWTCKQISDCSFFLQKDKAAHAIIPLFGACPNSSWWWGNQSGMCPPVSTDQQNRKHSSPSCQFKLDSTCVECNVGTLLLYLQSNGETPLLRYTQFSCCYEIRFRTNWILCDHMYNVRRDKSTHSSFCGCGAIALLWTLSIDTSSCTAASWDSDRFYTSRFWQEIVG